MVAQQQFNNLNFSDSDLSEPQPLDFTMSKFKSSTPAKHPLYHQFFGSSIGDNRDVVEEQGENCPIAQMNTFWAAIIRPKKRPSAVLAWLADYTFY